RRRAVQRGGTARVLAGQDGGAVRGDLRARGAAAARRGERRSTNARVRRAGDGAPRRASRPTAPVARDRVAAGGGGAGACGPAARGAARTRRRVPRGADPAAERDGAAPAGERG